jgi:hypothetical protein
MQVRVKREMAVSSMPQRIRAPVASGAGPMRIALPRFKPGTSSGGQASEHCVSREGSEQRDSARMSCAQDTSMSMHGNVGSDVTRECAASTPNGRWSQNSVREWIEQRYHAADLSRPLTSMDMDGLLQLAGFPQVCTLLVRRFACTEPACLFVQMGLLNGTRIAWMHNNTICCACACNLSLLWSRDIGACSRQH